MHWNSSRSPLWAVLGWLLLSKGALAAAPQPDWLIDPSPYRAQVQVGRDRPEVILDNGLLRKNEAAAVINQFTTHFKTDLHDDSAESRY